MPSYRKIKELLKNDNRKKVLKKKSSRKKTRKKVLVNSKGLENIDRTAVGLEKFHSIFINENLTHKNNKIAFHCGELKRNSRIDKTYSRDSIVQIASKDIKNGKKIKIMHMNTLHDRFRDFNFGEDAREDHND